MANERVKSASDVPSEALKGCPFCGRANDPENGHLAYTVIWVYTLGGEKGHACVARCKECHAEGPLAFTEEDAVRLWNGRHESIKR